MAGVDPSAQRYPGGYLEGEGSPAYAPGSRGGRERGYTTFLVMVLLVTMSLYGMESWIKANAQDRMARREAQSRQALYAAEGGIEWAKAQLRTNPTVTSGNVSLGPDQVQISILPSGGGYWVTSTARSSQAERKIKVYLQIDSGKWLATHYQELHQ